MLTTTSRFLVLFLAPAALMTADADAAALSPVPRHLVRLPQEASPPEVAPPVQPAPGNPALAGTPADQGVSPDDAELFARAGRLLQSRCAMPGCHLGPDARQGLRLEFGQIYRSSVNVRSRTESRLLRVVPGAPEQSLLYLKLLPPDQGHYRGPRMPRGMDPLTPEEIALVRLWIEAFPKERWGSPPAASKVATRGARTFQDSALVNLPTSDPLGSRALEFRILHRFKSPVTDAGSHGFYGLDSDAWVSIGLAYGLTDSLEVGLRRTNLEHDYEGYAKWVPIRQAPGHAPLSLALRGSFSNIREKGAFNTDRYGAQAVLARRFGEHLSLMLVPTYETRTNYLDPADTRGTRAVGAGAELRINPKMAITGEWITPVGGVENDFQSGSLGFSIATARHAFVICVTNTAGAHTDLYAPGGDLDAGKGNYRLGFNISRTYATH